MTMGKWLADKDKCAKAEAAKEAQAAAKAAEPVKKGWFGRLLDRAQQPVK